MKERVVGLDIYRILAMLMITALHINYQHCNLLNNPDLSGTLYCAGLIIEYICYAGVNCFAMLSGYLLGECRGGYDHKWGYRCISFYGKMVWWGILLYLLIFFAFPGGMEYDLNVKKTVFPFIGFWWYISAYCGVLIFMPLINRGLSKCSDRDIVILLTVMMIMFSVIPNYYRDYGHLAFNGGYSMIWLMVCFIYGAGIKKLMPQILKIRKINLIVILLLPVSMVTPVILEIGIGRRYMDYTTPFCVLEAACLLILFSQVKTVKPGIIKTISFVSNNSLGIYLIQNYPYFWENFIVRRDPPIYEPVKYLWYLPGMVAAVMAVGVLGNFIADKLYQWAGFDRICRKIFAINR